MNLNALPLTPRAVAAALFVVSAGTLGTALASQYIGGLQPCVLCIWQRWPYAVVMALAILALAAAGRKVTAVVAAASGVIFLFGASVAAFHVGVEQHWWQGLTSCGGNIDLDASIEDLGKALLAAPAVRCDQIPWSLFGISMAGYNFLVSLAYAAVAFWAARRMMAERSA